ncbi:MFS transporter [Aminobacter aganoensis]|uniref:AAHS family 4-hydroxybenzoate transporter-like MFS transporter n=1 Tax=Aminobacter aganoensis TaxID=83264 RepID=A0A7X0KLQ9_9HYPH|nr:AAHS family 4-hydroxybenzoate transporter-like MFS transporter [Aminobacter aganoensis]
MRTTTLDIRQVLDERPVSSLQLRVFFLCFLVALLDGFDTQAIAYTGPAIAKAFGMSPGDMTYIFISGTLGMALGAMGLGMIGDRIGRRVAILGSIVLFGVFSLAIAFAQSPTQIVALRFLTGLGMGGATPVLLAMAAEYSPSRLRGAVLTGVLLGLPAGAMVGGVLAAGWMPVIGWQGIYIVGGAIPLVVLLICLAFLPESAQFLASRGRPEDLSRARRLVARIAGKPIADGTVFMVPPVAGKGSVAALFTPEYRTSTIAIWSIYLLNWIAWFMFLLWLPTALTGMGLDQPTAALGTVIVNAAFIVFAIPLSIFLPRIDVRRTLTVMFMIGIAVCAGLALVNTSWTVVFALVALAGFGIGGQQIALNYLISSTYPTELRATGTGWAIGIGRTGAIVGSAAGGWLLQAGGTSGYFAGLAVPLVLAAVAVVLVRTRRQAPVEAFAAGH